MKVALASVAIGFLFCFATIVDLAQSAPSSTLRLSEYSSPEALAQRLSSDDDDVRIKAATSVGLADPINKAICDRFEDVQIHPISVRKGVDSRLISIKASSACQSMFLVPMLNQGDSWIALNPIRLLAHYDDPSWRLEGLVAAGEQEIVVSNQTVDWGTGHQQRNMTIYKVIENETRMIFDAPESIVTDVPRAGMGPRWENGFEEVQNSKFEFVHDANTFGLVLIHETRKESVQKRKFTAYRDYVWEPSIDAFRMIGSEPR